jgi:hypothetical protein
MSTTTTEVKDLPGAEFTGYYAAWPEMGNQAFAGKQRIAANVNAALKSAFDFACRTWAHDAELARAASQPLPSKPVSPPSQVVVREDMPYNGGTWIAVIDGPGFGVCPDLPVPATVLPGGGITGIVPVGTPSQPSQDAKLDYLSTQLALALVQLGAINTAMQKVQAKLGV